MKARVLTGQPADSKTAWVTYPGPARELRCPGRLTADCLLLVCAELGSCGPGQFTRLKNQMPPGHVGAQDHVKSRHLQPSYRLTEVSYTRSVWAQPQWFSMVTAYLKHLGNL